MLYDPKWTKKQKAKRADKPLSQIFEEAAALIDQRGHSIGQLVDNKGRMCVWGAISHVVTGNAVAGANNKTQGVMLQLRPFTENIHPVHWNNHPERQKHEVVSMLRKAAAAHSAK